MNRWPVPIARELVPARPAPPPEAFTQVSSRISGALPHLIPLEGDATLVVVVPTGLAAQWRDADPTQTISSSAPAFEVRDKEEDEREPIGAVGHAPARMFLRAGGSLRGGLPLTASVRRKIPDSGEPTPVPVEVMLIDWRLHAGDLRGAGDFGSQVRFAWRRLDRGTARFAAPSISPQLRCRPGETSRFESDPNAPDPIERRRRGRERRSTA